MDHDRVGASRSRRFPPRAAALCLAAVAGLGGGCEVPVLPDLPSLPELPALPHLPWLPGVYRIDVQQGNVVEQQMLDRLEIGMERSKVRFIMGTPLLVDPFSRDRWDYVYRLRRGSGETIAQRVTLYFVDDRLARVEGDLASEAVPEATAERAQTRVKVPKRQPPEGFLERLMPDFLSGDDEPADSGPGDDETADGEAEDGAPPATE